MMFMMPMPPTSRDMPAMAPRKSAKVSWVSVRVSIVSSWLVMVKSSSSVILWRSLSTVATSAIVSSLLAGSSICTLIDDTATPPPAVRPEDSL